LYSFINFYFVKDGDRKFANTTASTPTSNVNDIKRIVHVTGMVVENNKRIVQDWINEGSGWIEYKDDKINGKGMIIFINGDIFDGEFEDGK
jgi:hypothetical protein